MKLKKLAAFALAVLIAISALSVTVFATDPIGTNATTLKDGEKTSASLPYDSSKNYDKGHNYVDFKYVAASDGDLTITFDAAIDRFGLRVYNSDSQAITDYKWTANTGTGSNVLRSTEYKWDSNSGLFSGSYNCKVKKGTYYIRINRIFERYFADGTKGNGRIHIKCELELPKAPTNIKTSVNGTSVKFTWTEPANGTSYDLRYRVKGTENWTIKKSINDNNVTIKNLKANTNYEYQMRSYSGKTVGKWGKTGKFKTSGSAYSGKLGVPSAKTSAVTVQWGEVKNALSYEIRYKTGSGNWTTKTVSGTSYAISVSAGKTYTYSVRAVNGKNKGDWSANKTFTA